VDYEDEALNQKRAKALVGLELAFNNDFTRTSFTNEGIQAEGAELNKIHREIERIANAWIDAARADAQAHNWNLAVTREAHPQGSGHIFGKAFDGPDETRMGRIRFTYTNLGEDLDATGTSDDEWKKQDQEGELWRESAKADEAAGAFSKENGSWWWGITLDPGVFELQTKPSTWATLHFTQVKSIIETSIFGAANQLGLSADKGQGGGQINVDFQTGFGGDYNQVLKTLDNLEKSKDRIERSGLTESDDINAPYIYGSTRIDSKKKGTPVDLEEKWRLLYKKYKNEMQDEDDWKAFLREFSDLLRMFPSKAQGKKDWLSRQDAFIGSDTHAEDITHFQALNVGHITNADPRLRRVELRDFKAQASFDEILQSIDLAFSVMP
jgi:hypothetical protein